MNTQQMTRREAVGHTMGLAELKAHIRTLITLEETEAPVLSCYVNRDFVQDSPRFTLEWRVQAVRRVLERDEREPFEVAYECIQRFLGNEIRPTTRGVAVFARGGAQPFFLGLQFDVPLPDLLCVDSTPTIYHLVELKDTYHRYVVLITTKESARILEVNLGGITQELWAERPELRERVGREWTRAHYQNHRRDRGKRFLKEKIDVLDKLMSAGGHTHLILAGSRQLTAQVRNYLPNHLQAKLIDIVSASANDKVTDVVAATLSSFIEREQQESLVAVAELVKELRRGGLAAAGTGATLKALRRGQADMLVMAGAYQPLPGLGCNRCSWLDVLPPDARGICPECGANELQPVDLKEAMVKLAERLSAEVEFVCSSDALMELGGVGCLLRYRTPEQNG